MKSVDYRFRSVTMRGLNDIVGSLLHSGYPSCSVRELHGHLRSSNVYLAEQLKHLCSELPPDIFITYHSAENFVDVNKFLDNTRNFIGHLLLQERPDLDPREVEKMTWDGITFWVDFVFIDQTSRDIRRELEALPDLIDGARSHVVLSAQALTRAWCCYEIGLFNRHTKTYPLSERAVTAGVQMFELLSFMPPNGHRYSGWDETHVTEPEDKRFIESEIRNAYPDGFDGFNRIMKQASLHTDLRAFGTELQYPPAAKAWMRDCALAWFERGLWRNQST